MVFVDSDVEIIEQKPGLKGALQCAEYAGRTCYNSYNKMTDDSYDDFIKMLIGLKHTSPLEFATIYLETPEGSEVDCFWKECRTYDRNNLQDRDKYCRIRYMEGIAYITTNYNELLIWDRLDDLKCLVDEPSVYHEQRVMVKWSPIARGIADEFRTHRTFSHCIQSTRYCNYSRADKFGDDIRFVLPIKAYKIKDRLGIEDMAGLTGNDLARKLSEYDEGFAAYAKSLEQAESGYKALLSHAWTPQEARGVLGLDVMTEHCMCGFVSDWNRFLNLRCGKGAHPDASALARRLFSKIKGEHADYGVNCSSEKNL